MSDADNTLMLSILRELRSDLRQHRDMLLQLVEASRRHDRRFDDIDGRFGDVERRFGDMERRIGDLRGELELMLKGELLGRLTHFETQIDERLSELSDRINAVAPPPH